MEHAPPPARKRIADVASDFGLHITLLVMGAAVLAVKEWVIRPLAHSPIEYHALQGLQGIGWGTLLVGSLILSIRLLYKLLRD